MRNENEPRLLLARDIDDVFSQGDNISLISIISRLAFGRNAFYPPQSPTPPLKLLVAPKRGKKEEKKGMNDKVDQEDVVIRTIFIDEASFRIDSIDEILEIDFQFSERKKEKKKGGEENFHRRKSFCYRELWTDRGIHTHICTYTHTYIHTQKERKEENEKYA